MMNEQLAKEIEYAVSVVHIKFANASREEIDNEWTQLTRRIHAAEQEGNEGRVIFLRAIRSELDKV